MDPVDYCSPVQHRQQPHCSLVQWLMRRKRAWVKPLTFHINDIIYLCTLYGVYENVELLNMHVEIQYFGVVFSLLNIIINLHITDELTSTVLTLLVIYIVYAIFAVIRAWLFTLAGQRLVARLRKHLFNHIIQQDVAFFDTNR